MCVLEIFHVSSDIHVFRLVDRPSGFLYAIPYLNE